MPGLATSLTLVVVACGHVDERVLAHLHCRPLIVVGVHEGTLLHPAGTGSHLGEGGAWSSTFAQKAILRQPHL